MGRHDTWNDQTRFAIQAIAARPLVTRLERGQPKVDGIMAWTHEVVHQFITKCPCRSVGRKILTSVDGTDVAGLSAES
jgi:hypothetical protein